MSAESISLLSTANGWNAPPANESTYIGDAPSRHAAESRPD
jgi:hypothetical protein